MEEWNNGMMDEKIVTGCGLRVPCYEMKDTGYEWWVNALRLAPHDFQQKQGLKSEDQGKRKEV
jgi:hypothetical protein